MSQFSRDNHYVPQFYLKQWANNKHKVWEYRLLVSNQNVPIWKSSSVKDAIGWQRDLYTGFVENKETDEIEHWYEHEIESPAQYILEKIENGEKLSKINFQALIRFVAAQHVRTPAAYFRGQTIFNKSVNEKINKDFSLLTDNSVGYLKQKNDSGRYNKHSKWLPVKIDIEQVCDNNNKGEVRLTTGFTRNAWHFMCQILLNNTYTCLLDHDWHIIKVPPGVNLYTSDDPAVFMNFYEQGKYDFLGGWGRESGDVFFPLSPNYFLFTEIGRCINQHELNKKKPLLTYWMQRATIENASRSIFSSRDNSNIVFCRERIVDLEAFTKEQSMWKDWNKKQIKFEHEFD